MDVQRCAKLHNRIAALHASSAFLHPGCQRRRNFFEVYADSPIVLTLRSRLTDDVISFLELTDYFRFSDSSTDEGAEHEGTRESSEEPAVKRSRTARVVKDPSFTPYLDFPQPNDFFRYEDWSVEDTDEGVLRDAVILLYPGINVEYGGLFFDMTTNLACWASVDAAFTWPERPKEWISLVRVLTRYLECWNSGKFIMNSESWEPPRGCAVVEPFAQNDLDETIREWNKLLDVTEQRAASGLAPQRDDPEPQRLLTLEDLEDTETLQALNLVSSGVDQDDTSAGRKFALAFLKTARVPRIPDLRVAPGIGCFSLQDMREKLQRNRQRSRERNTMLQRFGMRRPILLFPYVDKGISQWQEFENTGIKELLLDVCPGLYLTIQDTNSPDTTKFVSSRPVQVVKYDFSADKFWDEDSVRDLQALNADAAEHEARHFGASEEHEEGTDNASEQLSEEEDDEDEEESVLRYGNDVLFSHYFYQCPFFGNHAPRLVTILRTWRKLVESGTVNVGPNGVEGLMEDLWERARETRVGLTEFDVGRCW